MRVFCNLIITVCFISIITLSVSGGELGENLKERIESSSPDELIKVWISLGRVESLASLKASAGPSAQTRAARYRAVAERLRSTHQEAQAQTLAELSRLQKSGQARGIKPYWITNLIEAELQVSELTRLAARPEIKKIYAVVEPTLIAPVDESEPPLRDPQADSIAPHLTYINADQAWLAGYTGAGRLVCSFDTGVDGAHPALASRWKGLDGDSAAAWFDQAFDEKFPHATVYNQTHGTHTMGSMVGRDTSISYTIGVAPEAQWISAAVVDIPGTSRLDAFQWAADPDGDPNTIDDLPDVINHSWGFYVSNGSLVIDCENVFFDLIDNVEALGIVNIFAGGNTYSPTTIHNPAKGDRDSLDCFAVGNLNATLDPPSRHGSSSQGPSTCSGGIKPNVMAPGTDIISCVPDNRYLAKSGTSMATPQVAGLVALLRQKDPNATVDEIKEAILASTQADASWGALPNNAYGWGAIDCMAALNFIGDNQSDPTTLHIDGFAHAPINPGDTVGGNITMLNTGEAATNVWGQLTNSNSALNVLSGFISFGSIALNGSATSTGLIEVVVADTVDIGSMLPLDLVITGDSSLNETLTVYFHVGNNAVRGEVTHTTQSIEFSLSNYGVYGLGSLSMFRAGGLGFSFNNAANSLWEGGLIIGTSPTQIASSVHSFIDRPDMDFKPASGGEMVMVEPGRSGAQESFSSFTDAYASNPTGITIRQHSFSYDFPNDKFIIMRYVLENLTDTAINNLYFGLMLDWDLPNTINGSNAGGYDELSEILWQAYNNGSTLSAYRGMKMLDGTLSGALTESATDVSWILLWDNQSADGFTDAEKFSSLTAGIPAGDPFANAQDDLFQMMNSGPYNLAPGQVDSLTIAILAGNTLSDLADAASLAAMVPTDILDSPEQVLPTAFALYQNYPNPFNPITNIVFDLPKASDYQLQIYNVLGQTVYQVSDKASPGRVTLSWDASAVASGVYFYKVTAGQFSDSKKMLLLK